MAVNKSNQVLLHFSLQNRQGRVSKLGVPMLTLKVGGQRKEILTEETSGKPILDFMYSSSLCI
jgi:hypothetical protein